MAEPWFAAARLLVVPPLRLWFAWRLEGLERIPHTGPVLVACNHASYLDPLANGYAILTAGRYPRFLAKQELFDVPLLGRALRGMGQIPVRRGTRDRGALEAAQRALVAGEVVVIYPEGTVTTRPDHLPMAGKTGAVRLSLATGVPILPIASWGTHPVWQKSGPGSLRPRRPIWIKVGTPIDLSDRRREADDHDALVAMTAEVMEALTALVHDLRARYPRAWLEEG